MKKIILQLLCRDLLKLKEELNLYTNETDLWIVRHDVKNSAGSLALHLVGNLNHYIGATIGKTGYVRLCKISSLSEHIIFEFTWTFTSFFLSSWFRNFIWQ